MLSLLLPGTSGNAFGWETDPKSASDNESAILKRVLDNWRARQMRIKTFYFVWNTQWTSKESTVPVIARRQEFWMDENMRYRTEERWNRRQATKTKPDPSQQPELQKLFEVAFDGPTSYRLDFFTNPPDGKVQSPAEPQPWNECRRYPILLAYRPLARNTAHFRVLSQNAIIGKMHCVKLQYRFARSVENFWVDPARDDLVVAWENDPGTNSATFLTIEYDRKGKYDWVPSSWTYDPSSAGRTTSGRVTEFVLNERIPQDKFTLKFPPGTTVFDKKLLERYVVAKDGSKSNLLRIDSPETLKICEALDQHVEFLIDPEPLKDALDFIAQRYQVKVTIDARAVQNGSIDPYVEVQTTIAGIKLGRMLNTLLSKSAKPLTYEVRKGELIITSARK